MRVPNALYSSIESGDVRCLCLDGVQGQYSPLSFLCWKGRASFGKRHAGERNVCDSLPVLFSRWRHDTLPVLFFEIASRVIYLGVILQYFRLEEQVGRRSRISARPKTPCEVRLHPHVVDTNVGARCLLLLPTVQVYKEHGYLWHFTLEEQMDYGPSIVAKFAHHERRVLEDLGQRVRDLFCQKPPSRLCSSLIDLGHFAEHVAIVCTVL